MRYLVRTSLVQVIGSIWMPATTAAMTYTLSSYDVENARDEDGQITRESVQAWLDTHAGDFASVDDFWASIEDGDETIDLDWADEESEFIFNDCTYGDEE